MAMGLTDDDTPNLLAEEFLGLAMKVNKENRLVVNNNDDVFCLNELCGEEIPLQRRLAIPGARFCITCQGAADRRINNMIADSRARLG